MRYFFSILNPDFKNNFTVSSDVYDAKIQKSFDYTKYVIEIYLFFAIAEGITSRKTGVVFYRLSSDAIKEPNTTNLWISLFFEADNYFISKKLLF